MPLLELHHVSRRYGPVQALRDVSLELEPGTIGLVGNNGAGKSTLIKILLGLLAPDTGEGTILGFDLRRGSRELRGQVGYMPENAVVVPVLRGVEFVTLSGDLYGMPHRVARRRAHEVLNYVGLGELRYRRLEEYSTGNLQRLKLAAALVHDPQLLLLDEPTGGLDPQGRVAMLRLLADLIKETGKSIILCTHLLGDVEQLCQQVVVIDRGIIVSAGRMSQLREQVGNRYELAWQGVSNQFVDTLRDAGAEVSRAEASTAIVSVPPDWDTRTFFALARESNVVLIRLKPEQEDLRQLFARVTQAAAHNGAAATISPDRVGEQSETT